MKTYTTTIEIDEVEVNISIEFKAEFGEVEIQLITDIENGCAIAPDLLDKHVSDQLHNELHEFVAGDEQIELENHYRNDY